MTTLLLVRHGESEWNRTRRLQGQADAPLTTLGRRQVAGLRPVLAGFRCDHVVCSDLDRARESARLLGWDAPHLDARWREADLGEWTGRDSRELAAESDDYQRWRDGTHTPPGAESFDELRKRVADAIGDLHDGRTTLAVTHGGTIRAVLDHLVGLAPDRILPAAPGSLTVLQLDPEPRLRTYNLTGATTAATEVPD